MELKLVFAILFVLPFLAYNVKAQEPVIYDLTKYGAKPDADISQVSSKVMINIISMHSQNIDAYINKTKQNKIIIPIYVCVRSYRMFGRRHVNQQTQAKL